MKIRTVFFLFCFLLSALWLPCSGYAACFNPPGNAGDLNYNGAYNVMQFCNGGSWLKIGGAGNTANGLVGWWKLDDGSGTSAADSSGNGETISVNHGAPIATWTTGINNGALAFTAANTDYGTAGDAAQIDIAGSWTVSSWVMMTTLPAGGKTVRILVRDDNTPHQNYALAVDNTSVCSGLAWVTYFRTSGGTIVSSCDVASISTGTWYLVTGVYNSSTQNLYLYLNGSLVSTQSAGANLPTSASGLGLSLAAENGSAGSFLNGTLDDVRIYNRALSAADVMTLYGSTGGIYPGTPVTSPSQSSWDGCAIAGGRLYCWGENTYGEDGLGNNTAYKTPQPVGSDTTWTAVSTGGNDTCGIDAGKLYCWGQNAYGEDGLGNTTNYKTPQQIGTDTTWTVVSQGQNDTCGIDAGKLYCWGRNYYGADGQGNTTTQYDSPAQVGTDTTWTAVSQAYYSACGIDAGKLYCWGFNQYGQFGIGTTTSYYTPFQTGTDTTWTAVSTSGYDTCGVDAGKLYCMGNNGQGEDGQGNTSQYLTATRVGTDTTWTAVSTGGGYDSCGVDAGALYCWGLNQYGENGNSGSTKAPAQVGAATNWTAVTNQQFSGASYRDACGLLGIQLYCWGYNGAGEDGVGTGAQNNTPQLVAIGGAGGCTGPTGNMGDLMYNNDYHVPQFCNGTTWIPTGKVPGSGGGGCSAPAGSEGDTMFNKVFRVTQYCDGSTWRPMGGNVPITSLVGWWNFDEGSGPSAADSSGNGNTGTLTNSPTWTSSGKINNALVFANASNNYVDVANPANFAFDRTNPFSLSAWVYRTDATTEGDIFTKMNSSFVGYSLWMQPNGAGACSGSCTTNCLILQVVNTAVSNETCISVSNSAVTTNAWHHVVATYDGSSTAAGEHIYVDGVLQTPTSSISTVSTSILVANDLRIGTASTAGGSFTGTIDDARVYNRALTAGEVWRLYSGAP